MSLNLDLFRTITLVIYVIWSLYWIIAARSAQKEKPKTRIANARVYVEYFITYAVGTILTLELLGLSFYPFSKPELQLPGLLLVIIGFVICILARRELSHNWTAGQEYQIKKGHTLITSGIYKYIRHPIYTGIFFMLFGGGLVAQSYFVMVVVIYALTRGTILAQREEQILSEHFGEKYKDYMKSSHRFIPFIY